VTTQAPGERIGLERALRAITVDAAYVIDMDRDVGSIEVGKFADFAVLDADPHAVGIGDLKGIPIWGTILGGLKQP
jgi:imidazolonepropionase-like amidohydrolase